MAGAWFRRRLGSCRLLLDGQLVMTACPHPWLPFPSKQPRVAKLSAGIQERLGRIRALTRDLELAAEEAEG